MTPKSLKIGVLLVGHKVQFLDIGGVDLFAITSKEYQREIDASEATLAKAVDTLTIEFVGVKQLAQVVGDVAFESTSAGADIRLQYLLGEGVQEPPLFDILFIPGADSKQPPVAEVSQFIRKHVDAGKDVLTVCSGITPAAHAGILDGRKATATRPFIPQFLTREFPKVQWDPQRRWVRDDTGKVWTAGSITNGIDMTRAYIAEKFGPDLAGFVTAIADVGDRPVEFTSTEMPELKYL